MIFKVASGECPFGIGMIVAMESYFYRYVDLSNYLYLHEICYFSWKPKPLLDYRNVVG